MASRLFALFILGLMLTLAGYILQTIQTALGLWPAVLYALGGLSLLAYLAVNRRDLGQLLTRRSARHGAASLLTVLAFLGILVLAGLFSQKHHHRWDLTRGKSHSLALQSIQQLERLDRDTLDLVAYVFYRGEDGRRSKQQLIDLLDTYAYHSDNFRYELVDIDRNPLLAMQLEISDVNTLILRYGEREEKIHSDQEAKLTNAIAALVGGAAPGVKGVVCFTTGHGEPKLEESEAFDYGRFRNAVQEQIGPVHELLLADGRPVPDSCEILVVAGPETDFLPTELEAIRGYLARGGRALFLVEPFMANNLGLLLAGYGIALGHDLVIDLGRAAAGSPFAFVVTDYPEHELTRFFDVATFFDLARSVAPDSATVTTATVAPLLATSDRGWAESDQELIRTRPDLVAQRAMEQGHTVSIGVTAVLAAAETGEEPDSAFADSAAASREARLVVIGDRDFVNNAYLGQLGNQDLALNSLRWLRGQTDQITITPRESEDQPLTMQRSELLTVVLVSVVALPLAVILTGLLVWIRRRAKR